MSRNELSFETVMRIHMVCELDQQQKGLHAWLDALRGGEVKAREETPLRTLKEISKLLGYHYTHLTRLGVQACGVSFGGRLRYDSNAVRSYLMGSECAARREELRRKRKDGVQ